MVAQVGVRFVLSVTKSRIHTYSGFVGETKKRGVSAVSGSKSFDP